MLLETTHAIMKRFGDAVVAILPPATTTTLRNDDLDYAVRFDGGTFSIQRVGGNDMLTSIIVDSQVGARYQAGSESPYFTNNGVGPAWEFHHSYYALTTEEYQVDELIRETLALMSLVIAPDREQ
jgi:hypothetical protein